MEQDTSPGEDSKSAPTVPAENPSMWSRGDDGKVNQERLSDPEDGITRRGPLSPTILRFGPLIHGLKNTCSKAITQAALNKVDTCLVLHKPFTVSRLFISFAVLEFTDSYTKKTCAFLAER